MDCRKTVVSNRLVQETETFKIKLTADTNSEIERLKNSLQMVALEHQVRFSKLHEHRARVIARLYQHAVRTIWCTESFVFQGSSNVEEFSRARQEVLKLYRFIELNKLYFSDSVCELLANFEGKLRHSVTFVGVYGQIEYPTPETRTKQHEVILAACEALKHDIPKLRHELETEFRSLLGVAQR